MAKATRTTSRQAQTSRVGIIEAITTPLGFYALALLIVEAFLGTAIVAGGLEQAEKKNFVFYGMGLFVLVTVAVFLLAWFKARELTYDKDAHLQRTGSQLRGAHIIAPGLSIRVDPGSATVDQIKELYEALANLNKLMGGDGFELVTETEPPEGNQ